MSAQRPVESALLTVQDLLFGETRYKIPVYQRNYAWGEEEIHQLIDDLADAALEDSNDDYFLGSLVVARSPRDDDTLSVIDGQQRLTTLYMLVTFLNSSTMARMPNAPLFESRARAVRTLERLGETPTEGEDVEPSILTGFKIIQQYARARDLVERVGFVLEQVKLVRLLLAPNTNANRYFEIMNTRGEQLTQQDIVKARLMSKLPEIGEQACFARIWDSCSEMDTYVQMTLTAGKPDARTEYFGTDWGRVRAPTFDVLANNEHVATGESTAAAKGLTLEEAIQRYATSSDEADTTREEQERFSPIIRFPSFLLHVLNVISGIGDEVEDSLDDKRLVKRFEAFLPEGEGAEAQAERVKLFAVNLLECRLAFDAFVLKREFTSRNADQGAWSLKRLVRGESNDRSTPRYVSTFPLSQGLDDDAPASMLQLNRRVLLIQSALRVTYTSPRTMHWVTEVLRFVRQAADPNDVRGDDLLGHLETIARNRLRPLFVNGVLSRRGFDIPRLVFTYLDYLLAVDAGDLEFQFLFRNSIEHFYPQSPDVKRQHLYGELVDPDSLNRLGNLALITVGDNSSFSNEPPSWKAEDKRAVPQSPKLAEMAARVKAASKRGQLWLDDEILEHDRECVSRLVRDLEPSARLVT